VDQFIDGALWKILVSVSRTSIGNIVIILKNTLISRSLFITDLGVLVLESAITASYASATPTPISMASVSLALIAPICSLSFDKGSAFSSSTRDTPFSLILVYITIIKV
jgi:hypothetical protein